MKVKEKRLIIITLIAFFALSSVIGSNLNSNVINAEEKTHNNTTTTTKNYVKNPKTSKSWIIEPINIDEVFGLNWTQTNSTYDWCNGKGTKADPYVIENVTIDAGGVGSGILINNSQNIIFIIRNCTIYNSSADGDAAIKLQNTSNGTLIDNNCSNNDGHGIMLLAGSNNKVLGNTVDNNDQMGVYIWSGSDDNIISKNNMTNNWGNGIFLWDACNNNISGNIAYDNDGSGISLYNSNHNIISGNNATNNSPYGISIWDSNNNTISENNATSNRLEGIFLGRYTFLARCDNNTISGNNVLMNGQNGIFIFNNTNNNIISGNTVSNNVDEGIYIWSGDNITISGNTVSFNNGHGIQTVGCNNSIILGNEIDNNDDGMRLYNSHFNNITENTLINNIYGIYLWGCNYNNVSGNILVGNVFNVTEDYCEGNIIENNDCYTAILPAGINEMEIEPYNIDGIDVNISIALEDDTEVFFSAFSKNPLDEPLDNGLIFMDLWLNDTSNLQDLDSDAPINITLTYDTSKYKEIEVRWFNESANGGEGAWEEIPFTDLGNGVIVISVNHTSIFALIGDIIPVPLSSSDDDDDDAKDKINIFIIVIILMIICSLSIVTASLSYHHYKPRRKTRIKPIKKETLMKKPLVKTYYEKNVKLTNLKDNVNNSNLLRILEENNALEKPTIFDDLNVTAISNEFWEKIDKLDLDVKDRKEFIKNMLSFTPEERQEILNEMLKLRESESKDANQQDHV